MKYTSIAEIEIKHIVRITKEYLYLNNYILDLFNDNRNIITKTNDSNIYYINGFYHQIIEDYNEMKKYYLMAIELGNSSMSMNNLAYYYRAVEKNYNEMKKYYLMAIELGNSMAMNNLSYYYQTVEKNYNEMKKYYLMAIEIGSSDAIDRLEMNISGLEFYMLLINIKNRNELIQNKISELEEDPKIIKYKKIMEDNNVNKNYDVKECIVCYSVEKHVEFDCKHEICVDCYMKMDSCYYRCLTCV